MNKLLTHIKTHRLESFLVFLLVVVAAFMRLYRIGDYMTFLGDEGRDVLVVYNILHGHLTLLGPTSSVGGFFLGPIYYYFMAPFLLLSNYDPVGPAVMIGLLGVVTVFIIYKIGSVIFGKPAGYLAAALYTVSPLVIGYSRSSWNPNPMPFFTLITLYILYKAVSKDNKWLFVVSGILFGICMQLHYIETFVGLIILIYTASGVFLFSKKKKVFQKITTIATNYLEILGGFLVGFSPFLAFEVRHGFPDFQNIYQFIFHSKDVTAGGNYLTIVTNVFFRLFGRLVTKYPPPDQYSLYNHSIFSFWTEAAMLLGLLSFGYFVSQYFYSIKKKNEKFLQYHLLLLWFVIGVLLFGFYKKPIYDYYFEFMFPLPFLFVGDFLSFLMTRSKWSWSIISKGIGALVFIALLLINLSGNPFQFEPNRQKHQVEQIADFVLSKTNNKPFNFALLSLGNSDHAYRYFFTIKGHEPVQIQHDGFKPDPKTITDQLLIVCEDPNCQPYGSSLWEVAGFGRGQIVGEWPVSVVKVYKLNHYTGKK